MDVYPQPLPKSLFDRAEELELATIGLHFSGGDDEGHLSVTTEPKKTNKYFKPINDWKERDKLKGKAKDAFDGYRQKVWSFEGDVEEWAWTVYEYSGAGDGTDYGDNVIYRLSKKTAEYNDWYMEAKQGETHKTKFEVVKDEE